MAKLLIVAAFRNFADASKNWNEKVEELLDTTMSSDKGNRPTK
jgi:hypothetical protein